MSLTTETDFFFFFLQLLLNCNWIPFDWPCPPFFFHLDHCEGIARQCNHQETTTTTTTLDLCVVHVHKGGAQCSYNDSVITDKPHKSQPEVEANTWHWLASGKLDCQLALVFWIWICKKVEYITLCPLKMKKVMIAVKQSFNPQWQTFRLTRD